MCLLVGVNMLALDMSMPPMPLMPDISILGVLASSRGSLLFWLGFCYV
jgi:hypothetical protein